MKHAITIEIDTDRLRSLTDSALAQWFHVSQANPAPYGDNHAGQIAEFIRHEIVKRWLANTPAELHSHMAHSHYAEILRKNGSWPGPNHDTWVYEPGKAEREAHSTERAP